ncbi:DDE-type integrase/transposase/recombinase [Candidatus Contubernalis alkaliaceticus]|uniref:DDE-type integrase/transposase/recombinase n=1 Tax=Candidatus Contubernalis alkaliaceticus TaxID=338645 RepID=UPI001F4C04F1|nr:DDE-type integrase/transposase/recombinase [Candidatus Contubernalis alkalaceticus]UNC92024.1 DDE-type integrase/transposase/recombinase [Candidatus Contubernalis alkalaceticus]
MLDENTRNAIALKRFSLISPVINRQVTNNIEYFCKITEEPIEMPHYGPRKYAPKTIESWYCDYMRGGLDALMPRPRGDKGGSRQISEELGEKILEKKKCYPKAPNTVIYEMLVKEGLIDPAKVSISTVYRYLKSIRQKVTVTVDDEEEKEMKRFSHEYINELWQTDAMYGIYIKDGKKKRRTYLFAYLDDCSRICCHGQFYFSQNFETLRHSFKEALLKRGLPTLLYTDNAKIYRSQQFELICAGLGVTLIHSKPLQPNTRGKIERFFLAVRKRFLSTLDANSIKDIDDLNNRFFKWLDQDYNKKPHTSLDGLTPLDLYMSQINRAKLCSDPKLMDEKFLLKKRRTVHHDGTFSIDKILFETSTRFGGFSVEVRYEPSWLDEPFKPLLIYLDDKPVGEARRVNFQDNAHVKRRGRPPSKSHAEVEFVENECLEDTSVRQTISFSEMMEEE